jgi:hypothetical protein
MVILRLFAHCYFELVSVSVWRFTEFFFFSARFHFWPAYCDRLKVWISGWTHFHPYSKLGISYGFKTFRLLGKVQGRIVNDMQNGGLGCSPSPPGQDQGIQKFSSERLNTRDSDKGLSSYQALPGLGQRIP